MPFFSGGSPLLCWRGRAKLGWGREAWGHMRLPVLAGAVGSEGGHQNEAVREPEVLMDAVSAWSDPPVCRLGPWCCGGR